MSVRALDKEEKQTVPEQLQPKFEWHRDEQPRIQSERPSSGPMAAQDRIDEGDDNYGDDEEAV